MPTQRKHQIIRVNTVAVITHFEQTNTTLLHIDIETGRTGVHAVLEQLLHNRCGALDNLSGGNLVGEGWG